jgi:hypothetical protein
MPAGGRLADARGFTLAEAVVCAGLLMVVASGVSQLVAIAVRASDAARTRTLATILAAQRMEQLRALSWSVESDLATDLSTDPPSASGRGLQPSPPGTLTSNVTPYVDYLTDEGDWAGTGASAPPGAVYTRRWSVRPLDDDPNHTLVLEVRVTRGRHASSQDVHLASIKTRVQ